MAGERCEYRPHPIKAENEPPRGPAPINNTWETDDNLGVAILIVITIYTLVYLSKLKSCYMVDFFLTNRKLLASGEAKWVIT